MTVAEAVHMDFDWGDEGLIPDHDLSDPARPVDNVTRVVGGDAATGRVEFITKWKPGHHCTHHRHLADTVSIVLAGELWVEKADGTLKLRPTGHYGFTRAGESHREYAGPQGATVFFSMRNPDGGAFESLDDAGARLSGSTVEQMLLMLPG